MWCQHGATPAAPCSYQSNPYSGNLGSGTERLCAAEQEITAVVGRELCSSLLGAKKQAQSSSKDIYWWVMEFWTTDYTWAW